MSMDSFMRKVFYDTISIPITIVAALAYAAVVSSTTNAAVDVKNTATEPHNFYT